MTSIIRYHPADHPTRAGKPITYKPLVCSDSESAEILSYALSIQKHLMESRHKIRTTLKFTKGGIASILVFPHQLRTFTITILPYEPLKGETTTSNCPSKIVVYLKPTKTKPPRYYLNIFNSQGKGLVFNRKPSIARIKLEAINQINIHKMEKNNGKSSPKHKKSS